MSRPNGLFLSTVQIVVLVSCASLAGAAVLQVPAGYPNIQAAVDAAADGDEVVLAPGTYTGQGNRDVSLSGKAVLIRSTDPADPATVAATVIDCQGTPLVPHHAVTLNYAASDPVSGLAGVTITGAHTSEGAVICDVSSQPVIRDCVITGNAGSGIYCNFYSVPDIVSCRIENNTTQGNGGGIHLALQVSTVIENCRIRNNSALSGGGIYSRESWPEIIDSEITGNYVSGQGGGLFWEDSGVLLQGCTTTDNQAQAGSGLYGRSIVYIDSVEVRGSTIRGNGTGADPQVVLDSADPAMEIDMLAVADSLVQGGESAVSLSAGWTLDWQPSNRSDTTPVVDPLPQASLRADINTDGKVDTVDLQRMVISWASLRGDSDYDTAADLDESGWINIRDLQLFIHDFGRQV